MPPARVSSTAVPTQRVSRNGPAFVRFRPLDGGYVVTSATGRWAWLDRDEFAALCEGRIGKDHPRHDELAAAGMLRAELDEDEAARTLRERLHHLFVGPSVHVLHVTSRCAPHCAACAAAGRDPSAGDDMPRDVAERIVDAAFMSTSNRLSIELGGGDPLVHLPLVRHIVEYGRKKNLLARKFVRFTLQTSLDPLSDDAVALIVDNRVLVRTVFDGPPDLHEAHRPFARSAPWRSVRDALTRLAQAFEAAGLDPAQYQPEASLTLRADTMTRWREVVDAYVEAGLRSIAFDPMPRLAFPGHAGATGDAPHASLDLFAQTYDEALRYILDLNRQGVPLRERVASTFLARILTADAAWDPDLRSPCGAGVGQLAFTPDGMAWTCPEGIGAGMLDDGADSSFRLASIRTAGYHDLMNHPTVRSLVVASTLEGHPEGWADAYAPYLAVCPVHNYLAQGSIHGRGRDNPLLARRIAVLDTLFRILRDADDETHSILERWARPAEEVTWFE